MLNRREAGVSQGIGSALTLRSKVLFAIVLQVAGIHSMKVGTMSLRQIYDNRTGESKVRAVLQQRRSFCLGRQVPSRIRD
jgi:hypothetical protein